MSTTDVATPEAEVLALPERNAQSQTSRKTTYEAGKTTVNTILLDDQQEHQQFVRFDAARLIRLSVRPQQAKTRQMLVLSMGIVLDGFDAGLIDEDGNAISHPLLSEPRYAHYRTLPHRINAQQWMDTKNLGKAVEFAKHLQANKGFRLDEDPPNPQNSQRKTRDLFQARPIDPLDLNNPQAFGAQMDGFEISVNPNYVDGFKNFINGLTDQQERWEAATAEEDPKLQAERLEQLRPNLHFVGGVYRDDERRNYWARPVDIGIVFMDGKKFPFYPIQGDELDLDRLHAKLQGLEETPAGAPAAATTGEAAPLTLPGGPSPADLQDF